MVIGERLFLFIRWGGKVGVAIFAKQMYQQKFAAVCLSKSRRKTVSTNEYE